MKKIFFVVVFFGGLLLFPVSKGSAQLLKSFSRDSVEYLNEIINFFDVSTYNSESKSFKEVFPSFWLSDNLTYAKRQNIYNISNAFLSKKIRAYPDFYNYFKVLLLFSEKNLPEPNYENWEKGLIQLVSNKKVSLKSIREYLIQTRDLLEKNIICKSYSAEWRSTSDYYYYDFTDQVVIVFKNTTLKCFTQKDSSTIVETSGTYYPIEKKWIGNKGKITWERAGFSPDTVFAEFKNYCIDMEKSKFSIDTAAFFNYKYFKEPLLGSLEEKLMYVGSKKKAAYPRFESFDKRVEIKNLYPKIDYNGGVTIHGAEFIGKGTSQELAQISISRNDSLFFTACSEYFTIRDNQVVGNNTEIKIFLDTSNLYHPGLLFKYLVDKHEINLVRGDKGLSKSPYFNNYHNIIMDFELLQWNVNEDLINCKMMMGTTMQQAHFESFDCFNTSQYERIRGMGKEHPFVSLYRYSKQIYSETFPIFGYANFIKKPLNEIRQQLIKLSFDGFVYYNKKSDEITINERLYNYIKFRLGKLDYDVIEFLSKTPASQNNATLNLKNYNLKINGIEQVKVSNSQNVIMYPKNKEIILKRNRDIEFDGKIIAGLFDLYGKGFFFSYKDFKINLDKIDSLLIRTLFDDVDYYGKRKTVKINSVIELITGNLLIDNPNNKSGLKKIPEYPIFNSVGNSYVYYENPKIQSGAYKKDKFYFEIDPYTIKSINNPDSINMEFGGTFVSDNIFPSFKETLVLMEDHSLGFKTKTPYSGYPIYGKGAYYRDITLDGKGLKGTGKLNYLALTFKLEDIVFVPEKMIAKTETFHLKEQINPVSQPEIRGNNVNTEWFPYKDEFLVKSGRTPLQMFHNKVTINGTIKLKPQGVSGSGDMNFYSTNLKSENFIYTNQTIDADTSDFKLTNKINNKVILETTGVKSHIDFALKKGDFINSELNKVMNFPINKYLCYVKSFTWFMDSNNIGIGIKNENLLTEIKQKNTDNDLDEDIYTHFVSTHRKQDSLNFKTLYAYYDVQKQIIYADNVKEISIADAIVYPKNGKVTIEKNALIQTLKQAKIITDTTNSYHNLYDATVNIHGRKFLSGSAKYDYIDINKQKQPILLDSIYINSSGQISATGKIDEENPFKLSPNFDFKGDVELRSKDQFLKFNGYTHINNDNKKIDANWLQFSSVINPNEILIPITDTLKNDKKQYIYSNFFLTNDSTHIYPTFLSKRKFYTDNVLIKAKGVLTFDKKNKKYIITSKEKLNNRKLSGNLISLNSKGDSLIAEGQISLETNLGQIHQFSAGSIKHDINKNETSLDIMLGLDFFFSDPAIKIMENKFKEASLKKSSQTQSNLTKKLTEIMGFETATKEVMFTNNDGHFKKLPPKLLHTILFNKLNLVWNKENKSYQSVGEISIGNINKTQLNKAVKGKIEIRKRRSGNRLIMYFEISNEDWFFFKYHHGIMFAISSDEKFNKIIADLKPTKRKMKKTDKQIKTPYSFILTPRSDKDKFKKRFNL